VVNEEEGNGKPPPLVVARNDNDIEKSGGDWSMSSPEVVHDLSIQSNKVG